jgi:selenobiotic family peptide radical SAM maturase
MAFLELLRSLGIYSMVMLTLTEANIDQVLPLAERLKGRTDLFTFNRLSQVGEGKTLKAVPKAGFARFLADCLNAAEQTAAVDLKDSLFNILLERGGKPLFGGCTGFGCGAAFNFAALLPDGEVHACRKFPSPIGDIRRQRLEEIYDGETARRYRAGSAACRACRLRPVCGGCMAVIYGSGLDPFRDKDPYCFL